MVATLVLTVSYRCGPSQQFSTEFSFHDLTLKFCSIQIEKLKICYSASISLILLAYIDPKDNPVINAPSYIIPHISMGNVYSNAMMIA